MVGENLIKEMETNDGGNYFRPSVPNARVLLVQTLGGRWKTF